MKAGFCFARNIHEGESRVRSGPLAVPGAGVRHPAKHLGDTIGILAAGPISSDVCGRRIFAMGVAAILLAGCTAPLTAAASNHGGAVRHSRISHADAYYANVTDRLGRDRL